MKGILSFFEGFSFSQNLSLSLEPVPGGLNRNLLDADVILMPGNLILNIAGPKGWDQVLPFYGADGVTLMSLKSTGITQDGIYYFTSESTSGKKSVPFMVVSEPDSDWNPAVLYLVQPSNTLIQSSGFQLSAAFSANTGAPWSVLSPELGPGRAFRILTKEGLTVRIAFEPSDIPHQYPFSWSPES